MGFATFEGSMRTRFSSLRTLIGAFLVAGGFVAACSSQTRHSDTTVAQAGPPLGQSHVARLPSNNSAAPPDAAETPERPVEQGLPLSRGAQGLPPARPYAPPSTPTNPSTPAPTPASPNAPVSAPAPNPIPPTGGGPTTPTSGGSGTGPSGTNPPRAQTDTGSTGSPSGDTPTSTQGPTTATGAANGRSMNAFGFEPFQAGSDGGVGPAPIQPADAGVAPMPLPRADGGIGGIGGSTSDGGLR